MTSKTRYNSISAHILDVSGVYCIWTYQYLSILIGGT
jgi:hypothetical protein